MIDAKCRGTVDYTRYDSDNRGQGQAVEAREECDGCPVIVECARYALGPDGKGHRSGMIWAGLPVPESTTTDSYREYTRMLEIIASYPTRDEL